MLAAREDWKRPMTETASEFMERKRREFERELTEARERRFRDIGRQGHHHWLREAWTFKVQDSLPEKVFVIERLRLTSHQGSLEHNPVVETMSTVLATGLLQRMGSAMANGCGVSSHLSFRQAS